MSGLDVDTAVHDIAASVAALDELIRGYVTQGGFSTDAWDDVPLRRTAQAPLLSVLRSAHEQAALDEDQLWQLLGLVVREITFFDHTIRNVIGARSREPAHFTYGTVDVGEILQDSVDLFHYRALRKGVEIRLTTREVPPIRGDSSALRRTFANLLDNAIKYSFVPPKSEEEKLRHVDVVCRRHSVDGQVLVEIQSFGVGITNDELSTRHIFEPGVRGSLASDRGRTGSGLGLSEARNTVHSHGGTIDIDSRAVGGDAFLTTVTIILQPTPP